MLSDLEVKKLHDQGLFIDGNSNEWQAVTLEGHVGSQFFTLVSAAGHTIVLEKFRKERGEFWKNYMREVRLGDDPMQNS